MTIGENAEVFYDRPVRDFLGPDDWEGPDHAYRLRATWEDPPGRLSDLLGELCDLEKADRLAALVIGAWMGDDSSRDSRAIIQALVDAKDRLPSLRGIFLGDITFEENEISWIQQSDVSPLLAAYPKLVEFRVRGGNGLRFSRIRHENLRRLIIETGGLPRSVLRELCLCEFPELEHLELWLGVENYGWDGGVEDLQPILAGDVFPKLAYLGLRNSDIVDEIAPVVVNSPILERLQVLDLSNGTLSDVGAQALVRMPPNVPLRELILDHHYMTAEMVATLKRTLPFRVRAEQGQDPDEEWRSVVVSE